MKKKVVKFLAILLVFVMTMNLNSIATLADVVMNEEVVNVIFNANLNDATVSFVQLDVNGNPKRWDSVPSGGSTFKVGERLGNTLSELTLVETDPNFEFVGWEVCIEVEEIDPETEEVYTRLEPIGHGHVYKTEEVYDYIPSTEYSEIIFRATYTDLSMPGQGTNGRPGPMTGGIYFKEGASDVIFNANGGNVEFDFLKEDGTSIHYNNMSCGDFISPGSAIDKHFSNLNVYNNMDTTAKFEGWQLYGANVTIEKDAEGNIMTWYTDAPELLEDGRIFSHEEALAYVVTKANYVYQFYAVWSWDAGTEPGPGPEWKPDFSNGYVDVIFDAAGGSVSFDFNDRYGMISCNGPSCGNFIYPWTIVGNCFCNLVVSHSDENKEFVGWELCGGYPVYNMDGSWSSSDLVVLDTSKFYTHEDALNYMPSGSHKIIVFRAVWTDGTTTPTPGGSESQDKINVMFDATGASVSFMSNGITYSGEQCGETFIKGTKLGDKISGIIANTYSEMETLAGWEVCVPITDSSNNVNPTTNLVPIGHELIQPEDIYNYVVNDNYSQIIFRAVWNYNPTPDPMPGDYIYIQFMANGGTIDFYNIVEQSSVGGPSPGFSMQNGQTISDVISRLTIIPDDESMTFEGWRVCANVMTDTEMEYREIMAGLLDTEDVLSYKPDGSYSTIYFEAVWSGGMTPGPGPNAGPGPITGMDHFDTSKVNVIFQGNGGNVSYTFNDGIGDPWTNSGENCGDNVPQNAFVGTYFSNLNISNTDAMASFGGWSVYGANATYDSATGKWNTDDPTILDASWLSTEQVLNYNVPVNYNVIIFYAEWIYGGNPDPGPGAGPNQGQNPVELFNNEYVNVMFSANGGGNVSFVLNMNGTEYQYGGPTSNEFIKPDNNILGFYIYGLNAMPYNMDSMLAGWNIYGADPIINKDGSWEIGPSTQLNNDYLQINDIYNYDFTDSYKIIIFEAVWETPEYVHIGFEMQDGVLVIGEWNHQHHEQDFVKGRTLREEGIVFNNPTYWTINREFEGWKLCTWESYEDENGNIWGDYVQIPGTSILSTEELLDYRINSDVYFLAQWAGDDSDYYSNVCIDGAGGEFTIGQIQWNEQTGQNTIFEYLTTGYGRNYRVSGDGIGWQLENLFGETFVREPVKSGAEFEGWIVYKVTETENGPIFELMSTELIDTQEMLSRPIPSHDVNYMAKWSDRDLESYPGMGNSNPNPGPGPGAGPNQGQNPTDLFNNGYVNVMFSANGGGNVSFVLNVYGTEYQYGGPTCNEFIYPDNNPLGFHISGLNARPYNMDSMLVGWNIYGANPIINGDGSWEIGPSTQLNNDYLQINDIYNYNFTDSYKIIIFEAVWSNGSNPNPGPGMGGPGPITNMEHFVEGKVDVIFEGNGGTVSYDSVNGSNSGIGCGELMDPNNTVGSHFSNVNITNTNTNARFAGWQIYGANLTYDDDKKVWNSDSPVLINGNWNSTGQILEYWVTADYDVIFFFAIWEYGTNPGPQGPGPITDIIHHDENKVGVIFNGNGGTVSYDSVNGSNSGMNCGDLMDPNNIVGSHFSNVNITNTNTNARFAGWQIYGANLTYDDDNKVWNSDYPVAIDTNWNMTGQILNYQVTADYDIIIFYAIWEYGSTSDPDMPGPIPSGLTGITNHQSGSTGIMFYLNGGNVNVDLLNSNIIDIQYNGMEMGYYVPQNSTVGSYFENLIPTNVDTTLEFKGWLLYGSDVFSNTDMNGNTTWHTEQRPELLADGKFFTTEEVLNFKATNADYIYIFNPIWSNGTGGSGTGPGNQGANIVIVGNDGTFIINGDIFDEYRTQVPVGETLLNTGVSFADPTFRNPSREFTGWKVYKWELIPNDKNDFDYIQVEQEELGLLTTDEVLNFVVDANYTFEAQWTNCINVMFNAAGGYVEFKYIRNDETHQFGGFNCGEYILPGSTVGDFFTDIIVYPPNSDYEFKGWKIYGAEPIYKENGDWSIGNVVLLSDDLLTVEDIAAYEVTDEYPIILFEAVWETPEYVHIGFEMQDGILVIGDRNHRYHEQDFVKGLTLREAGIVFNNPTYWTSNREFEGWKICTWQEFKDENGESYWDYVQIPGTSILSTEELLNYRINSDVYFLAQWAGDDSDYYSNVCIDGAGGEFSLGRMEWDEQSEQYTIIEYLTRGDGRNYRQTGDGIGWQLENLFGEKYISDPYKAGAEFEGWIVYKVTETENGPIFELMSTELIDTQEMLSRPIPSHDVNYMAKWSDRDFSDYPGFTSNVNVMTQYGDLVLADGTHIGSFGNNFVKGSTLRKEGFVFGDPVYNNRDKVFEGWSVCEWKEVDGTIQPVQIPGTSVLTTAQLLDYKIPDTDIVFVARWVGNESSWGSLFIYASGGDITWRFDHNGTIMQEEMGTEVYQILPNKTFKESMDIYGDGYVSVRKACSKLTGWTVYTAYSAEFYDILAGQDPIIGDPDMQLIYMYEYEDKDGVAWDRWIMLWYPEKTELLTTEEMLNLPGNKEYYVVANWENVHDLVHTEPKDVTCTEDGTKGYYTCKDCGKVFVDAECTTETTVADRVIKANGHDIVMTETKAPTCTENGINGYYTCKTCKKVFVDATGRIETSAEDFVVEALGHDMVKTHAKDATCTTAGNKAYYTCETCEKVYADEEGKTETTVKDSVIEALGHDMIQTPAKDATCTTAGTKGYYTCKGCEKVFIDAEGKYETTVANRVIVALGHDMVKTETKEPTCTETGTNGYYTCKTCEKVYVDAAGKKETTVEDCVIKAFGHYMVHTEAKDTTCTTAGNKEYYTCAVCEKVFADAEGQTETTVKDSVIAAPGHNYVKGTCTVCQDKVVVGDAVVEADKVEDVDTTKPVQVVTPVVKQEAVESTTKDVSKVVENIISDEISEETKEAVSEETIEEIKKEIELGNSITTEIVVNKVEESEIEETVVEEIKTVLEVTQKVAQYLDLSVMIQSVTETGEKKDLGTLNVLSEKISFTIVIPADLEKDGREFFVIRVHDGVAEKLEVTKNEDGSYSFETDRFSTYALAYEDVEEIPKTGDNTPFVLLLSVLGLGVAMLAGAMYRSKKYLVK